jgi:hypothetical protein
LAESLVWQRFQVIVKQLSISKPEEPKISGTKNNVFGIQTGIAVMLLVRVKKEKGV